MSCRARHVQSDTTAQQQSRFSVKPRAKAMLYIALKAPLVCCVVALVGILCFPAAAKATGHEIHVSANALPARNIDRGAPLIVAHKITQVHVGDVVAISTNDRDLVGTREVTYIDQREDRRVFYTEITDRGEVLAAALPSSRIIGEVKVPRANERSLIASTQSARTLSVVFALCICFAIIDQVVAAVACRRQEIHARNDKHAERVEH